MLLRNLILLIDVTFSTPTPVLDSYPKWWDYWGNSENHDMQIVVRARLANKGTDMKTNKDVSLLQYLLKGTRFGLVRWKPTGKDETFTSALKGGYVATVWKNNVRQYFKLENSEEQTQILVTSADSDCVDELYLEAQRKAFNVDKAIADIIRRGS